MKGLDWPGMQRLALGRLGLRPAEFWDLTPQEFLLMLGQQAVPPGLGRAGLVDLMQRFPDPTQTDETLADGTLADGTQADETLADGTLTDGTPTKSAPADPIPTDP